MKPNSFQKLIIEGVRAVWNTPAESSITPGKALRDDVLFLKDYTLLGTKPINGAKTWKFEFKTPDSSYLSHAFFVQYPNEAWKLRLEVDWKIKSKDLQVGAGKDFVMTFGPFRSYNEMVRELNRRLHNNPMIGTELYQDNNDLMLDREIIKLLKRIKENIGQIKEIDHPSLKTLENMYERIKDIPEEDLHKFCDDTFRGWAQKQGVIYKLQNIDKLPYYRSVKSNHATFKKPFPQKQ